MKACRLYWLATLLLVLSISFAFASTRGPPRYSLFPSDGRACEASDKNLYEVVERKLLDCY